MERLRAKNPIAARSRRRHKTERIGQIVSIYQASESTTVSITIVTLSSSTDTNPPEISLATNSAFAAAGVTRTRPVPSTAMSGSCPTRTPSSPPTAGTTTDCAAPDQMVWSAATTSTCNCATSAPIRQITASTLVLLVGRLCVASPQGANRLSALLQAQFLLQTLVVTLEVFEPTNVEECLLWDFVVLALGDSLERLDGFGNRDR